MGMTFLDRIARELVDGGLLPTTPVAIVTDATTARQRILITSLEAAGAAAEHGGFGAPAIVAIGSVVALQPILAPYAITLGAAAR